MKILNSLLFVVCFSFIASCIAEQEKVIIKSGLYANEYGEIRLIKENDTLMRAIFKNNEGFTFDTTLVIDYNNKLVSKPFLRFQMGGLELRNECLYIHEFSSIAYLSQFIQIKEMYTRPFYKIDEEVTVNGDVISMKGYTINGIWLVSSKEIPQRYVSIHGTIKKEKYPKDYYSTDESPQGMFRDTSIVHYRLIMEDYTIEDIPKQTFKGTTINIDNQAAFIYEFANSEAFYLDKKEPWTTEELNKKVEIKAVLVQFIEGKSVLKNWILISKN